MTVRGSVNIRLEPTVQVRLRGPGGTVELTVVVDTGFTGALVLPARNVAWLQLPLAAQRSVKFGDGGIRELSAYDAEVEWDGVWRAVLAYSTGREPLVGTRLLAGHQVRVELAPGGAVEITPLP